MNEYIIRTDQELRDAYSLKRMLRDGGVPEEKLANIKRGIRAYASKPVSKIRVLQDDGFYVTALMPLPDNIKTGQEAKGYFEKNEVIRQTSSLECARKAFTIWYKVFERRGKWFAYHRISFDF